MTGDKREEIETLLQRSQTPKTAAQIRKELPARLRMSSGELTGLLDEMAADGRIFRWPQRVFWSQDSAQAVRRKILDFLAGSAAVATAKIKTALKMPLELIQPALENLVEKGMIYVWQPGKTPHYCLHEPRRAALDVILKALADGPLPDKELINRIRKSLPGYQAKHLKEHISGSDRVFEYPKYGRVKTQYGLKPPDPGPYLSKAVQEILSVHKLLAPFRVSLEAIHEALWRKAGLKGEAGAFAGIPSQGRKTSREVESMVLEGITRLQPPGQRRALVSIRELRRSVNLAKSVFDDAVFSLALGGKVALHHHDFPASLNPAEREELVRDEQGTYYVGIVPRETA